MRTTHMLSTGPPFCASPQPLSVLPYQEILINSRTGMRPASPIGEYSNRESPQLQGVAGLLAEASLVIAAHLVNSCKRAAIHLGRQRHIDRRIRFVDHQQLFAPRRDKELGFNLAHGANRSCDEAITGMKVVL